MDIREDKGRIIVRSSDKHMQKITAVKELWEKKCLVDVTIKVGKKEIPAHRYILMGAIPFFKSIFCSSSDAIKRDVIELQGIDEKALDVFIKFAYTGSVDISVDNVQSLIVGATFFQLFEIQDVCASYLSKRLCIDNVIGVHLLASSLKCIRLLEVTTKFMNRYFVEVTSSQEYLNLDIKNVINIVRKEELQAHYDEEVLNAATRWVKYDLKNREKMLPELLNHIRLPVLKDQFLVNFSRK